MNVLFELFWRFLTISLLAFGGGGAALALVERMTVHETGWITPDQFAAAVSFGYVTPGPILILAAFVGYAAAGLAGATAATLGVFVMPWALAALAARTLRRYMRHPRLRGFGRAAAPAVVALLGVTVISLSRSGLVNWGYAVIAAGAAGLTARTTLQPVVVLLLGAGAGALIGLPDVASHLPALRIP